MREYLTIVNLTGANGSPIHYKSYVGSSFNLVPKEHILFAEAARIGKTIYLSNAMFSYWHLRVEGVPLEEKFKHARIYIHAYIDKLVENALKCQD